MLLETQDLAYTYPAGKQEILHEINIRFRPGEIAAITGDNGCGKTTLTKLLVGILRPGTGRICLGGNDIAAMSLAEIGRQIAYVFQNPAQQIFCTSVEQEIGYGLKNLGLGRNEIEQRISHYLDYFELSEYRQTFPLSLSQGEKQRLMLAAVLAMHPRYVILDEPTTGLDIYRRKLLGDYLLRIKKDGYGVIFVSHQVKFIKAYADRVIRIEDGRLSDGRGDCG
ncbi:MAG: ABC transporter ATP-binding protein [Syntrophomonadaceae bacterium]|nr:ABC transporter ATP-binding protein [Syntrophomonadaceae bacterium]